MKTQTKTKKRDKKDIIKSILLIAAILVIFVLLLKQYGASPKVLSGVMMDDSQQDIHEDEKNNTSGAEYTSFPGYSKIKVGKDDLNVQLKNPAGNTVNFVYTITKDADSGETVFTGSQEDAAKFVSSNEKTYTNERQGNECLFKDESGNTYREVDAYRTEPSGDSVNVIKFKRQMVYFTNGIAPGKSVDWKIKQYISDSADVNINISTYDTETNAPCVGTNIKTQIIFI